MFSPDFLIIAAAEVAHAAESAQSSGLNIVWPKIVAQIVVFVIVASLLNKFAFGPLLATMDERNRKIDDGLKFADDMKARLAEAEKDAMAKRKQAAEEAAKIIADARDNAKAFVEKEQQLAITKAEEIIKKAEHAMELERKQMVQEVRAEVSQLVVQLTGAVLARELSDDERSRFTDSATRELASRN